MSGRMADSSQRDAGRTRGPAGARRQPGLQSSTHFQISDPSISGTWMRDSKHIGSACGMFIRALDCMSIRPEV